MTFLPMYLYASNDKIINTAASTKCNGLWPVWNLENGPFFDEY